MRKFELNALLTKTNEVAFYPAHIETEAKYLPYQQRHHRRIVCPAGLIRGVVLDTKTEWIEKRQISVCGDQDYEFTHKNGILVEFDLEDFKKEYKIHVSGDKVYLNNGQDKVKDMELYPHTTADHSEKKTKLRMIVSHAVIFAGWGEYSLLREQRDQDSVRERERRQRIYQSLGNLNGFAPENLDKTSIQTLFKLSGGFNRVDYDYTTGDFIEDRSKRIEVGRIYVDLDQAEFIYKMLTPKQRAKIKENAEALMADRMKRTGIGETQTKE